MVWRSLRPDHIDEQNIATAFKRLAKPQPAKQSKAVKKQSRGVQLTLTELRPSSNLISGGWGADHDVPETCSRVEMSLMQEGAIRARGRLRGVAEWMHSSSG